MMAPPGDPDGQFARRLDHLWETVHPGPRPYTYEQVHEGLLKMGCDISRSYLHALRKGIKTNPTLQHIQGLAAFFGVPAAYFLDPAEEARINRQLDLLVAMRDARVRSVALRAHGLEGEDLETVTTLLSGLRRARGLGEVDDGTTNESAEEHHDR